jgi:hypothetical protein
MEPTSFDANIAQASMKVSPFQVDTVNTTGGG